jgi:RNA polymerase sigma-70 factor (ECF subfamily)
MAGEPGRRRGISEDDPGFTKAGARGVVPMGVATGGQFASGQTDAFEREALACLDSLYRTALRLSHDRADAEDLVQDTYLKAFRAADRFETGTNLRAWLFTILHNTAKNRFRDRARERVIVDGEAVDRAADGPAPASLARGVETPETLLLRDTLAPALQSAIDALPDAFREAVWLRDVEEFSYAEIAKMLDVPIGTVMSRISRGRHLLFESLNPTRAAALSPVPAISAASAEP